MQKLLSQSLHFTVCTSLHPLGGGSNPNAKPTASGGVTGSHSPLRVAEESPPAGHDAGKRSFWGAGPGTFSHAERSACVRLPARATPSRPPAPLVTGAAGRARASASPWLHHGTPGQGDCRVFASKRARGLNQSGRNLNHECSLLFYVGRSSNTLCCSQKKK